MAPVVGEGFIYRAGSERPGLEVDVLEGGGMGKREDLIEFNMDDRVGASSKQRVLWGGFPVCSG